MKHWSRTLQMLLLCGSLMTASAAAQELAEYPAEVTDTNPLEWSEDTENIENEIRVSLSGEDTEEPPVDEEQPSGGENEEPPVDEEQPPSGGENEEPSADKEQPSSGEEPDEPSADEEQPPSGEENEKPPSDEEPDEDATQPPLEIPRPAPIEITQIGEWYPYTSAFAVAKDDTEAWTALQEYELSEGYTTITVYTADDYLEAPIHWDISAVDIHITGVYQAIGTVMLPEGNYTFAPDLRFPQPTIPISIQETGHPELNCFFTGRGQIIFPWVTPLGDLENISVWLSENEDEWKQLTDKFYCDDYEFDLYTSLLTKGNTYRLQVEYEGGKTGIVTLLYDGQITLQKYSQGDRDGGDSSGTNPPDFVQPAPPTPQPDDSNSTTEPSAPDKDTKPEQPDNTDTVHKPQTGTNPKSSTSHVSGWSIEKQASSVLPDIQNIPSETTKAPETTETSSMDTDTVVAPVVSENPIILDTPVRISEPVQSHIYTNTPVLSSVSQDAQTIPQTESTESNSVPNTKQPVEQETPASQPILESFGQDTDVLSGARLRAMIENGSVSFTKHGILVVFSKETLQEMPLTDTDRISVTIAQPDANTFTFDWAINEVPQADCIGTQVMIPYAAPEKGMLSLLDANQNQVAVGIYDAALQVVTFSIAHTGTYTIAKSKIETAAAQNAVSEDITSEQKNLPLAAGIAAVCAASIGGIFLRRKRT